MGNLTRKETGRGMVGWAEWGDWLAQGDEMREGEKQAEANAVQATDETRN